VTIPDIGIPELARPQTVIWACTFPHHDTSTDGGPGLI